VSLDRIAAFLAEDDVTDQVSSLSNNFAEPTLPGFEERGIGIVDASFRWNETKPPKNSDNQHSPSSVFSTSNAGINVDSEIAISINGSLISEPMDNRFELRDISIIFPEGKLSVIIGPTASGKTALLVCLTSVLIAPSLLIRCEQLALLGEMTLLPGGRIIMSKNPSSVDAHGLMHSISYAAQTPWLQHQSIRENILFGYPYDGDRYNSVIECCALKSDLEVLEDGDATEIGDRQEISRFLLRVLAV
jgi:ABC-type transport system involved in cytochrome bd biosynthesis fused ATPase/permease subunit